MRRFEYEDAKSKKFWEIELEGDAYTVRYGKLGTDGQVQTKTFGSSATAEAAAEKLVKSKLKKGYVEVESAEAKAASTSARNPKLEAKILDDPDDLAAWQVYADWLQGKGDIWGERLGLSLQREQTKGSTKSKLTKQLTAFEQDHAEALYGKSFAALIKKRDFEQVARLSMKHGLILGATVKTPEYDWKGTKPATVLAALVKSPAARLLRSLTIGMLDQAYPVSLYGGVLAISKAGKLESLRELFIGDFEFPDENEISWVEVGHVDKALQVTPKLRSLHLRGAGIGLGKLEHPTLEHLWIETGGLPAAAVSSIAKAKLPALHTLDVWLGTDEYGGTGSIRSLAPLFGSKDLPKLRHLGLRNSDFEDDIASALATSKLLAQLETVDLSMGTMHGAGAEAIVEHAQSFAHLESLDLSRNYIPDELCAQLREALGNKLTIGEQREPDDWGDDELHYYTSVGE